MRTAPLSPSATDPVRSSLTVMSGAPTVSRSPGPACSSATRPAYGTGISTTAFAVSTSTTSWSTATMSPT